MGGGDQVLDLNSPMMTRLTFCSFIIIRINKNPYNFIQKQLDVNKRIITIAILVVAIAIASVYAYSSTQSLTPPEENSIEIQPTNTTGRDIQITVSETIGIETPP